MSRPHFREGAGKSPRSHSQLCAGSEKDFLLCSQGRPGPGALAYCWGVDLTSWEAPPSYSAWAELPGSAARSLRQSGATKSHVSRPGSCCHVTQPGSHADSAAHHRQKGLVQDGKTQPSSADSRQDMPPSELSPSPSCPSYPSRDGMKPEGVTDMAHSGQPHLQSEIRGKNTWPLWIRHLLVIIPYKNTLIPRPHGPLTPIRQDGWPWDPALSPVIVKSTRVPPPPTPAVYSWAVSGTKFISRHQRGEAGSKAGQCVDVWPWKHSRQRMGRDAADLGQPTADDPHGYFPSEDGNQVTGQDRGRARIPGLTKWTQFSKNSNRVLK